MGSQENSVRQERDRFVAFAFAAADLLLELDASGVIRFASGAAQQLTGYESPDLIGRPFTELVSRRDQRLAVILTRQLQKCTRIHPTSVRLAGTERNVLFGACRLPNASEDTYYVSLTSVSIPGTEKLTEAHRDPDSGALSKDDFGGLARDLINEAKITGQEATMTLLEFNGLDGIEGDSPLTETFAEIGGYLRAQSIGGDAVGKLASDKYGVIHSRSVDPQELEHQIEAISRETDPAGAGIDVNAHSVALDAETLNEEEIAGVLIYTINKFAENRGEGFTIKSLSEGVKGLAKETASRVSTLKQTLSQQAFDIVFQPIVHLNTNEVHHYEVLSRFAKGESPIEVITFAEDTGLIEELDLSVCQKAIEVIQTYAKRGKDVELAVNISGRSLKSTVFVETARKLLASLGDLRPRMLLEVTETAKIHDLMLVNDILKRFRADGVRVCLDDFGAGAACFPYLQALTVDYVKVDGAYVKDVLTNERDYAILKSMVSLCDSLKIETVAERVETDKHAIALRQLGIHYGQGWYYGKPTAEPEVAGDFKLRLARERQAQSKGSKARRSG